MKVTVWICPTEGCGNYYAASRLPDLRLAMNSDVKGNDTFSRAQCPDCRVRGVEVERRPIEVVLPGP